nr:RNA polymerase II C-terminal domain phosphatase-like 4 [Tanacetum cinerariifolium]
MLAERLGATCSTEVDPSVTDVISTNAGTEKSCCAVKEKKFLVEPRWLEATNFLWQRQPKEMFDVAVKEEMKTSRNKDLPAETEYSSSRNDDS